MNALTWFSMKRSCLAVDRLASLWEQTVSPEDGNKTQIT